MNNGEMLWGQLPSQRPLVPLAPAPPAPPNQRRDITDPAVAGCGDPPPPPPPPPVVNPPPTPASASPKGPEIGLGLGALISAVLTRQPSSFVTSVSPAKPDPPKTTDPPPPPPPAPAPSPEFVSTLTCHLIGPC
jgi:hypothetical protein